ncbi:hypothetical protein QOT17_015411 [Balamuthia mandrillaris]
MYERQETNQPTTNTQRHHLQQQPEIDEGNHGTWAYLTHELLHMVLEYCDAPSICMMEAVCLSWNRAINMTIEAADEKESVYTIRDQRFRSMFEDRFRCQELSTEEQPTCVCVHLYDLLLWKSLPPAAGYCLKRFPRQTAEELNVNADVVFPCSEETIGDMTRLRVGLCWKQKFFLQVRLIPLDRFVHSYVLLPAIICVRESQVFPSMLEREMVMNMFLEDAWPLLQTNVYAAVGVHLYQQKDLLRMFKLMLEVVRSYTDYVWDFVVARFKEDSLASPNDWIASLVCGLGEVLAERIFIGGDWWEKGLKTQGNGDVPRARITPTRLNLIMELFAPFKAHSLVPLAENEVPPSVESAWRSVVHVEHDVLRFVPCLPLVVVDVLLRYFAAALCTHWIEVKAEDLGLFHKAQRSVAKAYAVVFNWQSIIE